MRVLIMVFLMASAAICRAQSITDREHPRVSELQDKLTDYARGYLQTRLQGVPFMVTVKIEALRRQRRENYQPNSEKLPYYDVSEEEIRDEWDDPSASIYVLQSRIQKASVLISLPKALKEEEVQEIKDSLTSLLRLVPGRDEIKVELRNWSIGATFWYYTGLALGGTLLFLLGLFFISRVWTRRLANAIHDIKPKDRADADANASAPVQVGPGPGGLQGGASGSKGLGDLKFSDPLKTREFVSGRVAELVKNPGFPSLQAMIELDRLAEKSPSDLGALLMEFPIAKQKELFSLSYKPSWLSAFTDPGELTGDALELLDRLCRIQYDVQKKEWDQMLIQVWRQGSDRVKFLKTMMKDEAFAVLKAMPTSVAVPAARTAFPGAWAVLLDPTFKPIELTAGRIKELAWYGVEQKPLIDFAALDRYRQEKDLLSYLLISSVPEEKDIYGALPTDSFLWQVRPPFYQVLEQTNDTIKKIFDRVTLDEWALALFNVSRDYRKVVESLFNSKQKFLFTNKMRTIEQAGLDRAVLGAARERIARIYFNFAHDENAGQIGEGSTGTDDGNDPPGQKDENAA